MLVIVDRILIALLLLGACGHSLGSFKAYGDQPMTLLWSLCGSLYVVMLVALNILRSLRKNDRALSAIAGVGCLVWIVPSLVFGTLIGNPFDFRPMIFVLLCLGLALFNAKAFYFKSSS